MSGIQIRRANVDDVESIVRMIADDQLGRTRETEQDLAPYLRAFAEIDADPNQRLIVADAGTGPIGTLQLTIIPCLARAAATRGQIEAVRVRGSQRGRGLGSRLIAWAITEAERCGCSLIQLTSDTRRTEAHSLYRRLGFAPSHIGFKLQL